MMGNILQSDQALKVTKSPRVKGEQIDNSEKLLARLKEPKNKESIREAVETERRIRLHTVGKQDSTTSYDDWLLRIKSILPKNKFEVFEKLIGSPVPTLSLSETIFDELAKVFEASNPSQKLNFKDDSSTKTNELKNYINLDKFFKREVFNQLKIAPNSFLIVDALDTLVNGRTAPITYFVNIDSVVDVEVNRDGSTEYILFKTTDNKVIGIDKTSYYVFSKLEGSTEYDLSPDYPSPHNLKDRLGRAYCPAFLMYPNFLNASDNINVNSPLTKALEALEWLLFWSVSKRHLDLYAPFPIYVSFEEDCTFETAGFRCNDGMLVSTGEDETQTTTACPKCSNKKLFGAGTEIEVPAPQSKDEPNLIDAINVIPAESASIEYVTAEKIRLEQEIYYSILGKTSTPVENFSQSVSQLDLSTESRKAVLLSMKELFESVHEKTLYTVAQLMYGDDFIDCYVNYGDSYFLTTSEQETKNYKSLKDAGAPEGILHSTLERIVSTTYKTSPATALLNQIYLEVEPYQTMSIEAVSKLLTQRLVPKKKALEKVHFTDFIEDFESTHQAMVTMIEMGEASKTETLKKIKKQLSDYVQDIIDSIDEDIEKDSKLEDNQQTRLKNEIAKPVSIDKRKYREEDSK